MQEVESPLFSPVDPEPPKRRDMCDDCGRPRCVCLCQSFPENLVPIMTNIIILQHPNEENRTLATVPLLQKCIPTEKCHVLRGRRFGGKYEVLEKAITAPDSVVLFPSRTAVDLCRLPQRPICTDGAALIVIDGTWSQARGLFTHNEFLHRLQQVKLSDTATSEYVIRTQPTEASLSTLESIAYTLRWLEASPQLFDILVQPMRLLCHYQLEHGAVVHHSKEYKSK
ncbi:tRNA-uridine aminocarboxypropyltransferase 2-like isoform X2 [Dysidea avara]|uniref:tRNA-uridine aminocarboxypropyltransferase 2-like isoform X2 n=1 Tax=Dysidea avara TaxID=196820 RepID=UPI00332CFF16